MYPEDSAADEVASRPRHEQIHHWPDGMSAPPEYDTPHPTFSPAIDPPGLSQPLPHVVYVDPNVLLYDALRHLFAIAAENPEIVNHCRGTLDEARDALEIAKAFQLAKGAR